MTGRRVLGSRAARWTLTLSAALFVGGSQLATRGVLAQGEETPAALMARAGQSGNANATPTQLEEACTVYLQLLDRFPKDALAPRARLELGLCLARLGRTEDARARLREARATGKDDPALCHDAEQALMALPPETAPAKPADEKKAADDKKTDKGTKPGGKPETAPVGTNVPHKPAPPPSPEAEERAKLVKEIEDLEAKKKATIDEVHALEDAGRTGEAYALRAKADDFANKIEQVKQKIRALAQRPKGKPATPPATTAPAPRPELDEAAKQKLLLALRRDKAESSARLADQRAEEMRKAGKLEEAKAAQVEAGKARAEAAEAAEQLKKLEHAAAPADPGAQKEGELKAALDKSRAALREAEAKGDAAAKEAARADVKAKEKALQDLQAANEKAGLDRLANQMRKRGAPAWELDERLALAQKEIDLEHSYRDKERAVRKELADKNVAEDEVKTAVAALEKAKRDELEKLRADTEDRILARARVELEQELTKRAADLRAQGLTAHEVDVRMTEARRELEGKLPARAKAERRAVREAQKEAAKEREHSLLEENQRLKRRVDELEREVAALKAQLGRGGEVASPKGQPVAAEAVTPGK